MMRDLLVVADLLVSCYSTAGIYGLCSAYCRTTFCP